MLVGSARTRESLRASRFLSGDLAGSGRRRLGDSVAMTTSDVVRKLMTPQRTSSLRWLAWSWTRAFALYLVLCALLYPLLMMLYFRPSIDTFSGGLLNDKIFNFLVSGAIGAATSDEAEGCPNDAGSSSRVTIENVIGAAPIWLRNCFLVLLATKALAKCTGHEQEAHHRDAPVETIHGLISDFSHPLFATLVVGPAASLGRADAAGWNAIVGDMGLRWHGVSASVVAGLIGGTAQPRRMQQSTWRQAQEARRLTKRQALASALVKLVMWHLSQPCAYLWVLWAYRCHLRGTQRVFAVVVALRETMYLSNTLLAAICCPSFLLLDLVTSWQEAPTRFQKMMRFAAYVLTPHNYVSLCLANHFEPQEHPLGGDGDRLQWTNSDGTIKRGCCSRTCGCDSAPFLLQTALHILADFASCFALGLLLSENLSAGKRTPPTALLIGYALTASGFVCFIGPALIASQTFAAVSSGGGGAEDPVVLNPGERQQHAVVESDSVSDPLLATAATTVVVPRASVAAPRRDRRVWWPLRMFHGVVALILLGGWVYIVVGLVLLVLEVDIVCNGYTFDDPCNGHGRCFDGGSRCECMLGYGPQEPLEAWCRTDELTDEFTCQTELCETVDFSCDLVNNPCCTAECLLAASSGRFLAAGGYNCDADNTSLLPMPCVCPRGSGHDKPFKDGRSGHDITKHRRIGLQCTPAYEFSGALVEPTTSQGTHKGRCVLPGL